MALGNVLVTGGAGFIGSALSRELASTASRWVVLDSMHPQVHLTNHRPSELSEAAELFVGDVRAPADWDAVLRTVTPDVIFHLAAETGTAQSLDEASRHASVNVDGTTQMMDALGRHGVTPEHVVLSSSRAVYGEGNWRTTSGAVFQPGMRSHAMLSRGEWDFEDSEALENRADLTIPAPTSVYGATKLAQENILKAWGGARGVPISILRLQNVYGPGQSLINSYTGIVSLFSQWAREGKTIPLYEDGNITRDFVFIDDVVSALASVAKAGPDTARPVLDIGSGRATSIARLAQVIANFHGAPTPSVTGNFRDGDVRKAACDISLSEVAIAWSPKWSLERGISALQFWIETQLEEGKSEHDS